MGLRKSRYEGTNRGTTGTVVNQTLLLLPRFLNIQNDQKLNLDSTVLMKIKIA